jgi:asparagine synthase (glutamine-hydrolysing)
MKRTRYLVVRAAGDTIATARASMAQHLAPAGDFMILVNRDDLLIVADRPGITLGDGLILGDLFQCGGSGALTALNATAMTTVVGSRGSHLSRAWWGGYVAILTGIDRIDILRAPMGDLPCLYTSSPKGLFAGSDLELLAAAGAPLTGISWTSLARHLLAPDIRRAETCLEGVRDLCGGERLSATNHECKIETVWSPWDCAQPDRQVSDPVEAMRRLRGAIEHSVDMLASGRDEMLLLLSGGLDSSIVAAAMAKVDARVTAVNLVADDATSDERRYARAVADAFGFRLIERVRHIADVDLTRSEAARLPCPTARSFTQATSAITRQLAAQTDVTGIFNGGGGDNVFCSLRSVRPATDCLLAAEPAGAFWSTARTIASLAQTSVATVAIRAWLKKWRKDRIYRWLADTRFLSGDALALVGTRVDHPWLDAPETALPGKAAHVALIAQAQGVSEGADVAEFPPTFSPLLSQPVVEACVAVPTWLWFGSDRDRALARRTFDDRLPDHVIWRRSKGSPDGFIAAIFEAHRPLIRTMLLDGVLTRAGLLNVQQVAAALDDPRPPIGHAHLRLLGLVDAEVWAGNWRR